MRVVFKIEDLYAAVLSACTVDVRIKNNRYSLKKKLKGWNFHASPSPTIKLIHCLPYPQQKIILEKGTHFFDYEQKYMPGKGHKRNTPQCSEQLIKRIQDTCAQAMRALDITNISRIDGFVTQDERIVIIDPNTLSGMGPSSFLFREAAEIGMSHTYTINHLILKQNYTNWCITKNKTRNKYHAYYYE